MLNELDTKILKILFEEKTPVPSRDLALRCDVAINTLRKEIALLNEMAEQHGFRIASKTATGHFIEILDYGAAFPYMEKLKYLFERNRRMGNRNPWRISYLTRRCLCANGNLTVDNLCDDLYCSRSTLLRDLDKVKQDLKHFDLTLTNRRGGHGLSVEGNEWDLRQCLTYQHKIYTLSLEDESYKEYAFKSMFFMMADEDYYRVIRQELVNCLMEQQDFSLAIMNYPKIVHYIQLCASRQKHSGKICFTEEQIRRARNCPEYEFVKKLHRRLPGRFRDAMKENDALGLTMLILSYETQNRRLKFCQEYRSYYDETQELIDYLIRKWGYDREMFDEEFIEDWICFLYTLDNRRIFHVYDDMEYLGIVQHKGIRTADFCVCFSRFYEKKHGFRLSRQDTISAFYLFRRVLKNENSCYYAQNILIISRYGISFAKALAGNIRNEYGNEVKTVTAREYGEKWDDDTAEYDLLITDLGFERLRFFECYNLPILPVSFRLNQKRCPELDTYLDILQQESELEILTEDSFYDTNLKSKKDVFEYLAKIYEADGVDQQLLISHLAENDAYIDQERDNGIVFLPVLLDEVKQPRILVLINKTAFVWNENRSQIFVCYSRAPLPRENQIINQILSKFVHISAEAARAVVSHKEGSPILQLYPES